MICCCKETLVLNGEDGIIKKVEEESSNSVFLIRSDNYIRNWQNPEKLRKYIVKNFKMQGQIGCFDIYSKLQ